jgi:phage terminase small subunit
MPRQLNAPQRAFAEAYAKCGNATSSAIQAGYSEKTAPQMGCKLVKHKLIAVEIARLRSKLEKKSELSAQVIYDELAKLVTSNVKDLYDEQGNLKPIHELPDEVAATISSLEMGDKGSGIRKLKTHSKLEALSLASKLLGLVQETQNAQASVQIILAPAPAIPAPAVAHSKLLPEWGD